MFDEITLMSFLIISLVMMLGSSLQASAGFGSGLVAVPLLGLINSQFIPGPILVSYIFTSVFMCLKERKHVNYLSQASLIPGLFFGSLVAFMLIPFISQTYFPIVAACFVLLFVVISFFQNEIKLSKLNLVVAGSVSGLMSTLAGLSGPPMALVLQFQQPAFIRANLSFAFIFASIFSISTLYFKNLFSLHDFKLGLYLVPGMFVGLLLGGLTTPYIKKNTSRFLILSLSCVSSITLIIKSF